MASLPHPTRRHLLQVLGLSGAGFVIGHFAGSASAFAATLAPDAHQRPDAPLPIGPFIQIGTDDTITVIVRHIEIGQGVATGITTIIAEEMNASWKQMRFETAPLGDAYRRDSAFLGKGVQNTGGSSSIASSWVQMRMAGAAAREMLRAAAAARFGVATSDVTVVDGACHVGAQVASFGSLAEAAARIAPPPPDKLVLKEPSDFRFMGRERDANRVTGRIDAVAKTDGSARYALDFNPPGLLIAVVARSPKFGGKVASFDASAARAVRGVADIVEIDNGVAVVASDYWAAIKGREALVITWDNSQAETRSSDRLFADFADALEGPGAEVRKTGLGRAGLSGDGKLVTADIAFPYLVHAPMEPLNAVIELKPGVSSRITSGFQMPSFDQKAACAILGLAPDQVHIDVTLAGGSFGRRGTLDADLTVEAAQIAKAVNGRAPIKLMWSREDDIRGGRYRPMSIHRMSARVNRGKIEAWVDHTAIQSIWSGTPYLDEGKPDALAVEGADVLYAIPHVGIEVTSPNSPVPVLWWRSSAHSHTAFAKEHFIDIVARDMNVDPLELRRSMLRDQPRMARVLEVAAQAAGWDAALPQGRFRGIAMQKAFGSYVAQVAEIVAKSEGGFAVERVVCAIDCGIAVNPDIVRAQIEGGIGMALSALLHEQLTLKDGEPVQSNFHDYTVLRIDQMPRIEVHIVPSGEAPTGVGELGVPALGPAVANALLCASGKPVTRLPLDLAGAGKPTA